MAHWFFLCFCFFFLSILRSYTKRDYSLIEVIGFVVFYFFLGLAWKFRRFGPWILFLLFCVFSCCLNNSGRYFFYVYQVLYCRAVSCRITVFSVLVIPVEILIFFPFLGPLNSIRWFGNWSYPTVIGELLD